MLLFILLLIMLLLMVIATIFVISVGGAIGIFIFSDVIVCALLIVLIIKHFANKKEP